MFLGVATQKVFMVFWHGGPTEQALNGVFAKADFKWSLDIDMDADWTLSSSF